MTKKTEYSPPFFENEKEKAKNAEIVNKLIECFTVRSRAYRFFGTKHDPSTDLLQNRNLLTFINDSEKRFLSYKEQTTDAQVGQFRMSTPITHDKAIAIYSQFLARGLEVEIRAEIQRNPKAFKKAELISALYDIFDRPGFDGVHGSQMKLAQKALSLYVRGTVVTYLGFNKQTEKVKDIISYDEETGEGEYRNAKNVKREIFSEIVRLDKFYFGDIWEPDIQKQPYLIWEDYLSADEFKQEYQNHRRYKNVPANGEAAQDSSFFDQEFFSKAEADKGYYYRIKYYDRPNKEYHSIVNGVLMTPLESPFWWRHGRYPFGHEILEPLDPDGRFVYGNSGPNKLQDSHDIVNIFLNIYLTALAQTASPAIVTSDLDGMTEEEIGPNGIPMYKVSDANNTKELTFRGPNPAVFNVLDQMNKYIETSSISAQEQGVGATRAKTATESLREAEKAEEIQSALVRRMASLLTQESFLKVSNILQFMLSPAKLRYIGEEVDEDFNNLFAEYVLPNTDLSDGTQGDKVLRVFPEREMMSQDNSAIKDEEERALMYGRNVQIIETHKEYLNDFMYSTEVKVVPSQNKSKSLKMAMFRQFLDGEMAYFGDIVNREELHRKYILINEEDPEKLMAVAEQGQMPRQGGLPNSTLNNEITRGVKAQEPSLNEMLKK